MDQSAKSLKKMKVSKITTQFSSRLELLDGKFLRIGSLVVLGLDLVVGLAPDNLPDVCAGDYSMRLLHDDQSSVHNFLKCEVEDTNLICIADTQPSSTFKCDLPVQICPFPHTGPRCIQFFPASHCTVDHSRTGQECL